MTYPTATKDMMLNALTITHASLHTAFPGSTGSSEVTGGTPAYARQAITVGASSGGSRALSSAVVFDVPACTVRWVGLWNASAFLGCAPNGGGVPRNFIAAGGIVYSTGHGYADGQKVVFFNGTPPAGLTEGTVYFARDTAADSFKVAASTGGAAIALTGGASFGCVVCGITEDVYVSQGTHTLATASVGIPD